MQPLEVQNKLWSKLFQVFNLKEGALVMFNDKEGSNIWLMLNPPAASTVPVGFSGSSVALSTIFVLKD